MFTAILNLLIKPLELIFEFIFSFSYNLISNPGLAIVFLSLAMNLLVLPLYKKADAMQEQARETEEKLRPWVDHIKKNFTGDERYMILQTYYRQNHYKPTDALRGSVSLLLEVPFFMAAYNFLSQLQMLQGVSFGPIADLGAPDGMLVIGSLSINVLPIAMTLINIVSGYIYTKGFPAKAKIQLYGMALIFLVLLYTSPSGLVFYWTLNNVFSLVKNIFYKLKDPKKVLGWLCSGVSALMILFVLFIHPMGSPRRQLFVIGLLLLLQLPLILNIVSRRRTAPQKQVILEKKDRVTFYSGCLFLTVLTGLLIPSTVVANSPAEFVNSAALHNPCLYIFHAFLIAAGLFLIWFSIFYALAAPKGQKIMGYTIWLLSGAAVVDYMFFGKHYGNLSANLKFDQIPVPAGSEQLQNLLVLVIVLAVLFLIFKKKQEIVRVAYLAAILAAVGMSLVNFPGITKTAETRISEIEYFRQGQVTIPLSRQGKNVMVLMMDRAVGLNVPYILNEKPELKDQFAGFTFYPRTLSHGLNTNTGAPGLTGGYEYTPEQMNLRSQDSLQVKHDEALKVMPVLFSREGYDVTVLDPPNAGYGVIPESEVFADYPEMHVGWLMNRYENATPELSQAAEQKTVRSLFCYSLFKIAPVPLQPLVYTRGAYNDPDEIYAEYLFQYGLNDESGQITRGISNASGMSPDFMKSYRALQALPELTKVSDGAEDNFLFMANNTSHEAMMLQSPDYTPAMVVDNREYDSTHADRFVYEGHEMLADQDLQMSSYHCNMAYMIQLGNWFDYLRAQGVYDNTRIIIAADHGRDIGHFPGLIFPDEVSGDILHANPVLFVKDFGSSEPFTMDETFMTNADVPYLAVSGIVEDPHNPFTGKPISMDPKKEPQIVFESMEHCSYDESLTYDPAAWYRINGDMFSIDNWERLGDPSLTPQK